jgi:plastocyanin
MALPIRTPRARDTGARWATRLLRVVAGLSAAILTSTCGSAPTAPSGNSPTISIAAGGVSPKELRIKAWGQVTFVNNDSQPHTIASDPADLHTQCPPVNMVGLLRPGESRNTGTLNLTGVCGFHDHADKTQQAWKGRIIVE